MIRRSIVPDAKLPIEVTCKAFSFPICEAEPGQTPSLGACADGRTYRDEQRVTGAILCMITKIVILILTPFNIEKYRQICVNVGQRIGITLEQHSFNGQSYTINSLSNFNLFTSFMNSAIGVTR